MNIPVCDFSGYATRNDLLCGDGRTIRKNAFKDCDGQTVPLVWNHDHTSNNAVLGHALLENRDDGVYAYCTFNDTDSGKNAKEIVRHGDIRSLSIYANKLKQIGGDVIHGVIRELSLVHAGANPGAYIDYVMAHSEEDEDGLIANYDENALTIYHSDLKKEDSGMEENRSVSEIFEEMTEEQQNAVYELIGMIAEDEDDDDDYDEEDYDDDDEDDEDYDDDEGEYDMKHNVFDEEFEGGVLTHSDQSEILTMAKSSQVGSFQSALQIYADNNNLQHDALAGGFAQEGQYNVSTLFPEYKEVRPGAPELITDDQGWISVVMSKVHKSPISRIRTTQVDIRNIDALRAKGYKKGKGKALSGNFNLVRRTTDPQTVYVKNALHRDDIIDITDFDYVQYLYKIDRMMLNEELATAIMLGDGREDGDEAKISPEHIRPIWTDDDLYTIHVDLDVEKAKTELQGTGTGVSFGENYITAEAMTNTILYARENYKGSGTPDLYITPHMLNVMLLARDMNGRRIYSSKAELASTLNVANIYTAEQFEGKTRKDKEGNEKKLLGLVVNLADYSLGATKGGEITHFTQFDIDFNQQKSLLETRTSGALTRVYSAIAIEAPSESAAG